MGYRQHARRHLPGGTDPIVFPEGGIGITGLSGGLYLDDPDTQVPVGYGEPLAADGGVGGNETHWSTLTAALAGERAMLWGSFYAYVQDETAFAAFPELNFFPTWVTEWSGIGPFMVTGLKGRGAVLRDAVEVAAFDLFCINGYSLQAYDRATGNPMADGVPITFQNDDQISAFWEGWLIWAG